MAIDQPRDDNRIKLNGVDNVDLFAVFEAGWSFQQHLEGHCFDGRDVGRLLTSDYWPPILQGMERTAGLDASMSKVQAVVKVKQEISRRLGAA
jgi:hypothetical protein